MAKTASELVPGNRPLSFVEACRRYVNRYTMEHKPNWANVPVNPETGTRLYYYAPQYRTDREWYESTCYPGEGGISSRSSFCESTKQTWPIGKYLLAPFVIGEEYKGESID